MRYFLIDRILSLKKNASVRALKNVSLGEDVYGDHFVGFPVMPGALQIEAYAQAATALLEVSSGHRKKALLLMVENAKFRGLVSPGDQLLITMEVESMDESSARLDGTIHAGETLVSTARLVMGFGDPDTFNPRPMRFLVESFYRIWLQGAVLEGFDGTEGDDIG